MIAVDTNLLVYAHRLDSEWNETAFACLKSLSEGRTPWAIPWPCIHEFVSITTHSRIYMPPSTLRESLAQVRAWMATPTLVLLSEETGYWPELESLALAGKVRGPMVHDARIAALCALHGIRELWTADRDFNRLGVKTHNPLLATK